MAALAELEIVQDHIEFENANISAPLDDDDDEMGDPVAETVEQEKEAPAPMESDEDRENLPAEEKAGEVPVAGGKKGRKGAPTVARQTATRGGRKSVIDSTPRTTTRVPKRKAEPAPAVPRKSARLSATDDAPRATRASTKSKSGTASSRKAPSRGKGRR